jgi:hypothetical protein
MSESCDRIVCAADGQLLERQFAALEIPEDGEVSQTCAMGNVAVAEHGCCRG